MFVKIHMIQNFGPSNLNRGQDGRPKSCLLGGYQRARISSQSLKRTIRNSPLFAEKIETLGKSYQTRLLPSLVAERLKEEGIKGDIIDLFVSKVKGIGTSSGRGGKNNGEVPQTSQTLFFSEGELDTLVNILIEKADKSTKELKQFDLEDLVRKRFDTNGARISPEIALFGRFITSDIFPTIQSAVQVAPAISTNQRNLQTDYFVGIDELKGGEAAIIDEAEFVSPCFYKYFTVDMEQVLSNMALNYTHNFEADQVLIEMVDVLEAFIRAAVFDTSGGMQNKFAAHNLPSFIMAEIPSAPISYNYNNAFLTPISPTRDSDIINESIKALITHMNYLDKVYEFDGDTQRFGLFIGPYKNEEFNETCETFEEFITKVKTAIVNKE